MTTQQNASHAVGLVSSSRRTLSLLSGLVLCTALHCGQQEGAAAPDEAVAASQSSLYANGGRIWSRLQIPVCWENPGAGTAADREVARKAVADTWEAHSAVAFTGWGSCSLGSPGVHIRISDERPHVVALGDWLDGLLNGMVLNFTFRNWNSTARCKANPQDCIRVTTVHEFGHALGFSHEQNRPDNPDSCDEERSLDGDIPIGAWDLDSVMNYCNPKWNGDGKLSATDIAGLRMFYLGWQLSSGGTGAWQPLNSSDFNLPSLAFGDFNGDGKADVFRASGTAWYASFSGTNSWTQINNSGYPLDSLRFGDFNGDGKTDVFRASGTGWYVSFSGTGGWTQINNSGYTLDSLRFADFDGDGKTDVFRASGTGWYVSFSGTGGWTQINNSGYPLDSLRFADFDGDGKTDVFRASGTAWFISSAGTGGWTQINTSSLPLSRLGIADFDGDGKADVMRTRG